MGVQRNLEVSGVVSLMVSLLYTSQPFLFFFFSHAAPETSSMTVTLSSAHLLPLRVMTNASWLLIPKPGVSRVHACMCAPTYIVRLLVCVLELVREGRPALERCILAGRALENVGILHGTRLGRDIYIFLLINI